MNVHFFCNRATAFVATIVLLVGSSFVNTVEAKEGRRHKSSHNDSKAIKHNIQLQLFDANGYPVENTAFWITLKLQKDGTRVFMSVPGINFETGQFAADNVIEPGLEFLAPQITRLSGGTLRTVDGFLPECFRPSDALYKTFVIPSNTGQSLAGFAFINRTDPLPTPSVPAYNLGISFDGNVTIYGTGTFANLIPPGNQVTLPTEFFYTHDESQFVCKNVKISKGASDITQFTNAAIANDGYRDSHVCDAYKGLLAFSWIENTKSDPTSNIMNAAVAVGKVIDGKLKVGKPTLLTNFTTGPVTPFNTSIAFNRTDPNNIVASYGQVTTGAVPYRAVSFDGGKSWPINGPTNIQPTGNPSQFGDNRGVLCDKFGNFWYIITNGFDDSGTPTGQPAFWVSGDKGETFQVAYTVPLTAPFTVGEDVLDYPQVAFGGDGNGNYGLWYIADYFPGTLIDNGFDVIIVMGFIPINGPVTNSDLGNIGPVSDPVFLTDLENALDLPSLTASEDGRVWAKGGSTYLTAYISDQMLFKSPGPLDSNYVGPWQTHSTNNYVRMDALLIFGGAPLIFNYTSYPAFGYFLDSVNSILFDDSRQALYALTCLNSPDLSQDMRLYLLISRDNGQTWSQPYYIATSSFANRGFQCMALDPVKGNLIFSWYDGRNDKSMKKMEFFGAVLPAKKLDKLVNNIPLSNPLYKTGPATGSIPAAAQLTDQQKVFLNKLKGELKSKKSERRKGFVVAT